jgi:predicted transposase YbfD/YdcC
MPLSLVDALDHLDDPRSGPVHPLPEILLLTLCAVICSADTFVAIEHFGHSKLSLLRRLLPFKHGIPSHDTLGRVFARLDPEAFERWFQAWAHRLARSFDGEVVAIDGKTLHGSADAASGQPPLHLIEAWATEQRLTLGQRRSEGGRNEIETIPDLLAMLVLDGSVVTLDAMGCQVKIAEAIRQGGADYVLQVKGNQGELLADATELFDRLTEHGCLPGATDTDGGHGRVETRRCWAIDVEERGLLDTGRWPDLRTVAMIETERFEAQPGTARAGAPATGQTTVKRRYVISSLPADAERLLAATRGHWGIENSLHWVLDVAFGEDASQVRHPVASENLARVRRLAHGLLKRDTSVKGGVKTKRLRAGWDEVYLERLLTAL